MAGWGLRRGGRYQQETDVRTKGWEEGEKVNDGQEKKSAVREKIRSKMNK